MKVKYSDKLVFNLPQEFDIDERKEYVEMLLSTYSKYFNYTEDHDTRYDDNINRVLDAFAYYLCTAKKYDEDGKFINNDKEIMRRRKIENRRKTEMPLHDSVAYGSTYDD